VALTEVTAAAGNNMTFEACVQDCKADDSCQYITYRYRTSRCFKKTAGTGRSVRMRMLLVQLHACALSAAQCLPSEVVASAVGAPCISLSHTL
jgi:hypothetical protein